MSEKVAAAKKGNTASTYIHAAIVCLFMFGFQFIPAPAPITTYGMQVIGVFLGVIWGWSFCGLFWPSLLALFAMGFTQFGNEYTVWATAFGNQTAVLTLLSMLLFGALQATKTTDWLVGTLTSLKFVQGRPWVLTFMLLFIPLLLCSIVNVVVVILFMLAIFDDIFKKMGLQRGDKYAVLMVIGVNIFAGIGMVIFPFLGWDLMTIGTVSAATGVTLDYAKFMIVVWPSLILFCIAFVVMMKYVFKCDASKLANIQTINEEDAKLKKNQKYLLWLTVFYLVGCTFVGVVQGTTGIAFLATSMGVYGVTILVLGLMIFIKVDGKQLLEPMECTKFVSWDMFFLIVAALFIAGQITAEATGISTWAVAVIMPMISGVDVITFYIVLSIIAIVLTNIGNNLAMGFTLLALVGIMFNAGMPFNPMIAAILVTIFSLFGFLLPSSSIGGAFIHASEWCRKKDIYLYVSVTIVLGAVIVLGTVLPLSSLIF